VLDPVQWPVRAGNAHGERRFFAQGGFFTPDKKAHLIAPKPPAPHAALSQKFPFRLNTGRLRDQWHTMTRSGLSPRLANHAPEPCVEVHPDDAVAARLTPGGFARLRTPYGACVLKVAVNEGQRRGSLFAPIHWSDATASAGRVGELVASANDPHSGQPEAKATPAAIEPAQFRFHGFALTRDRVELPASTWWSRVTLVNGAGFLLATDDSPVFWRQHGATLFGAAEIAEYYDEPRDIYRLAAFLDGRFVGCLFLGPANSAPQFDAVKALFEAEILDETQRRAVLSGRSINGLADAGRLVCACFSVGLNAIRAAIDGGAKSVEAVGVALRAGTNCGSCLPEVKKIVAQGRIVQSV
jgi:assimilatory nitrate reductase catalytic subunit